MPQLINFTVTLALIAMMVSTGLGVTFDAIAVATKDRRLVFRAILANYVAFPLAAAALLVLFHAKPMVAAGFLILAVCPGAPFGPPFTSISKGNIAVSIGLMFILSGSSVFLAPALLHLLLPRLAASQTLDVNVARIAGTLLVSQLLPLLAALYIRHTRPTWADRLQKPFGLATKIVGLVAVVLVLMAQYRTLAEIHLAGVAGMLALWASSLAFGWLAGGTHVESRTAVAETTALRNVGVAMVIASSSFPGTPALPAVVAYGFVSILASLAVALVWGRRRSRGTPGVVGGRASATAA